MNKSIIAPLKRVMNMKTGETRLWFDQERSIAPDGTYRMMGGLFFPQSVTSPEGHTRIVGYAMMTGKHVKTGNVYVFSEREWFTADHILSEYDGGIDHEGLVTWLNEMWMSYYAANYAVRQYDDIQFSFLHDFNRCRMIEPKPKMIDAEWDHPDQPMSLIYRLKQLGLIHFSRIGDLHKQIAEYQANEDRENYIYPAVHCLRCIAMVLDRFYTR